MRKVIASVEVPFNGVTICIRRVCSETIDRTDAFCIKGDQTIVSKTLKHSEPHNEMVAIIPGRKRPKDLVRMKTGTDCSGDQLPEYLRLARRALTRALGKLHKVDKLDVSQLAIVETIPDFALALARSKHFEHAEQ